MRKFLIVVFSSLFLAALAMDACAQSREELEKKRKEIQLEIEELQQAQNAIRKDKKAGLGQLTLIQSKLKKRNAVISNIN